MVTMLRHTRPSLMPWKRHTAKLKVSVLVVFKSLGLINYCEDISSRKYKISGQKIQQGFKVFCWYALGLKSFPTLNNPT